MAQWNVDDKMGFIGALQKNTGQMSLNTKFGKYIYKYAKEDQYKNILEIETWNGVLTCGLVIL